MPRKNLRPVAGLPLVVRAIEAARGARYISRVVVSTDDVEIMECAHRAGAEVVQRPAALSDDHASSESAVLHALAELEQASGYRPELVMMIQCTTPMTQAADLDGAIEALLTQGADSCFTAVPFFHFVWRTGEDGTAEGVNHSGAKRARRQDLPPQMLENGAAYVMRSALFQQTKERFCGRTVVHLVPADRGLEIDSPQDLALAEALLRGQRNEARWEALPETVAALILDFDGVLTDNAVYVDQQGFETVRCDRADGMGIEHLRKAGIAVTILSKERNVVVQRRAEKLQVECQHAIDDKATAAQRWAVQRGIELSNCVYVGNDVNDLAVMAVVGCAVCPADAHPTVHAAAHIVLEQHGGHGAVRAVCDAILARRR